MPSSDLMVHILPRSTRVKSFLIYLQSWLNRRLHWLYLGLAAPIVTGSALLTPPFRVPDEQEHFLRSARVASWGFVEFSKDGIIGGYLDGGAIAFASILFDDWEGRLAPAIGQPKMKRAKKVGWTHEYHWRRIAGTSRYPFLLYLPQATGLATGRLFGANVLTSFYFGRMLNGLSAVAIACLAIALARRGKLLLVSIALLPMAVFEMGSMSQDAGIIALALLCAAIISRGRGANRRDYIILAGGIAILATARLPLIGLGLLLWLPMWRAHNRIGIKLQLAASAACLFLFCSWLAFILRIQGPVQAGPGASMNSQLAFLQSHPMAVLTTPWETARSDYNNWYRMFIGVLGWLDVNLPNSAYRLGAVALVCAGVVCVTERSSHMVVDRLLVGFTMGITLMSMLLLFYLTWSPVGASTIQGLQGRYLFAMMPLITTVLPSCRCAGRGWTALVACLTVVLCTGILLFLTIVSRREIRRHYRITSQLESCHEMASSHFSLVRAPYVDTSHLLARYPEKSCNRI